MQITDLNNSLLKAMTTGGEAKTKAADSESFADMLKSASVKPEAKKQAAGESNVAADYQQQTSSVEVKTADKTANRSAGADEAKSKAAEKPAKNQPQAKKAKSDNAKTDNNVATANQPAQPQAQEQTVAENADETIVTPIADDNGDMVVEVAAPVAGYAEMPIFENEAVAAGAEPEVAAPVMAVAENIVPQMPENAQPAEFIAPTVTPTVAEENIEQPQVVADNTPAEVADVAAPVVKEQVLPTANQVEAQPEEVIVAQEEKIAELLPEDTNIAVKVSVKEDKVTDSSSDKVVVPLLDNEVEAEPVELKADVADVQPEPEAAPQKAETTAQPQAAVLSVAEDVAAVEVEPQAEMTSPRAENAALSSSQAFVAGEGVRSTNAANQNTAADTAFKDVYDKGITREVAEQIKVNITQSAIKGVDKIEIQLKPAELGHLEIKMQISKDGRLQAHIVASDANTMELLQKDLSALKQAFDDAGFQTEDGSFSFSYRGDEQNNNERERLRTFIGEVIAQDVAEETAANDYIGADGVNIRV